MRQSRLHEAKVTQPDFAIVGKGAAMRAIFDKVAKTAPSSGRVLITGGIISNRPRLTIAIRF